MKKTQTKTENTLQPRPPIVVILGHVDHGKTSILDYIRKSKVAEKAARDEPRSIVERESGGITQHIGAYQIEHLSKLITFIDTPGHEAFSAMRSRGAKVADIAVLVVAAEEGVKPQTKEAISHILHLNLPMIVAINKIDKPVALPDKVKKELADNGVIVESLNGKIPAILVSAKTGIGIADMLEMILLIADMENFKADHSKLASGIIIESRMDAKRGPTATLLVREGILHKKDIIAAESAFGLIRSMENFLGQQIDQAFPSTPALITGFNRVPPVGEEWQAMKTLEEAKAQTEIKAEKEKHKREPAEILDIAPGQKIFNLILKADVSGSLEAVREALKTIPQEEIILRVVKAEVGDITENDIKLAESAKARIYGFRVKMPQDLEPLAQRRNVKTGVWQIIYELIQTVRQDASRLLAPEVSHEKSGKIRILALFKTEGKRQIIGGRVSSGKIERGLNADILRNEEKIGTGKIVQMQVNKAPSQECAKDKECGLMFESDVTVEKNDVLEAYREERTKREL
ncbi:translation initiation factor IF-2 [Patescibacteria group bacterium]|nr:translation initiation factor IF-2 [Patescibacteria group bacterium]